MSEFVKPFKIIGQGKFIAPEKPIEEKEKKDKSDDKKDN